MFVEAHAPERGSDAPLDYCRLEKGWSLGIEVERDHAIRRCLEAVTGSRRLCERSKTFRVFNKFPSPSLDSRGTPLLGRVSQFLFRYQSPVGPKGSVRRFTHGPHNTYRVQEKRSQANSNGECSITGRGETQEEKNVKVTREEEN
jgi:hypothetical protein